MTKATAITLPRIHSSYAGGEVMGVVGGLDGQPDYLLIDMGEAPDDLSWDEAMKWAAAREGESLPTRREQAVMFGNRREGQYQKRWYWSCEQYAGYDASAWCQTFDDGGQYYDRKDYEYRARAVRRVPFR